MAKSRKDQVEAECWNCVYHDKPVTYHRCKKCFLYSNFQSRFANKSLYL